MKIKYLLFHRPERKRNFQFAIIIVTFELFWNTIQLQILPRRRTMLDFLQVLSIVLNKFHIMTGSDSSCRKFMKLF